MLKFIQLPPASEPVFKPRRAFRLPPFPAFVAGLLVGFLCGPVAVLFWLLSH